MFGLPTFVPGATVDGLDGLPTERLEAELCQLGAQITSGMCRWLLLVAEFDRRGAAASWECTSTAAWLSWRCAIDPRTAREHVRVARALAGLPVTTAAFASGELSYSKVRALARVATPVTESELVDFAREATAAQLEKTVTAHARLLRAEAGDHSVSRAHVEWTDEATGRLTAELAAEDAAVVSAALDDAADELFDEEREGGSAEPPSSNAGRRARALVRWAEAHLDGRKVERNDTDRYLVLVHATVDPADGAVTGEVDGGAPLDAATVKRLLCDQPAAVLVDDGDGNALYLGRTTRLVTRAMRRALRGRDGPTCGFPGCANTKRLHAHHVKWWGRDLGTTDVDNLVHLCSRHHRLVHHGSVTIERDQRGRFTFRRSDGSRVVAAPALPAAAVPIEATNAVAGTTVVDEPAGGARARLDLDHTLIAMASQLKRARYDEAPLG